MGDRVEEAVDDPARRRKLQALQTTARNLVRARTETEIAQVTVETARDVLDCPLTGVWLYDDEDDMLKPAAVTDEGRDVLGKPVRFERGESLAWKAFETGEIGVYDDVSKVAEAYNPETPVRSEIDIPIGRHGVLTTATTEVSEFTQTDIDLLYILAANTEAVLDRTAREREVARYREMVEAASDPIWAVDTRGRITQFNESLVALIPHSREALLGSHLSVLFPGDGTRRVITHLRELRTADETATVLSEPVQLVGAGSREFQLSLSLLWETGDYSGTVFVAHDVTELRGNQQRLSVFNRILRHNLRNQLNVILGHLEQLETVQDEQVRAHAEGANRAADRLLTLGEKAQRFHAVTEPGGTPISTIDVISTTRRALAQARGDFPAATIEETLPETAWITGHSSLEFALHELVVNALTHSGADAHVTVTVLVRDDETVEIRVADDGPGLPANDRRALDGNVETPLEHASGLGLWLVRWTVVASGGSIHLEDGDGDGTVFVIRLPTATPPAE